MLSDAQLAEAMADPDLASEHGADNAPEWAKESLLMYADLGTPTGDCLRAFLANDLMAAVGRADVDTGRRFVAIASFIYNRIPSQSHGSYEAVDAWILMHRKRREAADE